MTTNERKTMICTAMDRLDRMVLLSAPTYQEDETALIAELDRISIHIEPDEMKNWNVRGALYDRLYAMLWDEWREARS